MGHTRVIRHLVVSALVALIVAGCSGEPRQTPQEIAASALIERRLELCGELADEVTETLQSYVDQFAPADADIDAELDGAVPSAESLQAAAARFQQRRGSLGCQPREFQVQLRMALEALDGVGPMGRAVVADVRDEVTEASGPAETVNVALGDDLAAAIHDAGPGALIRLAPGRHVLDEPLVLLRSLRIEGDGSGTTIVRSAADGAVVLDLGPGPFDASGVTFEHTGTAAASVVVLSTGSYRLHDVAIAGGVADEERSAGWGLVLGGGDQEGAVAPTSEVIEDATVRSNAAGGIVVVAGRAPTITGLVAEDNGGCGICFVGGGGTVTDSTFRANDSGISLAEDSAPTLTGLTVEDSVTAGLLAGGDSAGELMASSFDRNGSVGISTQDDAMLLMQDVSVGAHGEAGIVAEDASHPTITGGSSVGSPIGLLGRGSSVITIDGLAVSAVADAHVVFAAEVSGTASGVTCEDSDVPGIVLLDDADVDLSDNDCRRVDQR